MAIRKQKDPARVEAANKAWETMRGRYPERYGKTKQNNGPDNKTHDTLKNTQHNEPREVDAKWHVTSQSTLTLRVDLPMRERLTDFVDTPWTEKHRPVSLNDCVGDVVGYLKAFAKTGSFPLALIFYGEYGCGKTACAKALVRDYFVLRGLFNREATFMDVINATKVTREYDGARARDGWGLICGQCARELLLQQLRLRLQGSFRKVDFLDALRERDVDKTESALMVEDFIKEKLVLETGSELSWPEESNAAVEPLTATPKVERARLPLLLLEVWERALSCFLGISSGPLDRLQQMSRGA